MTETESPSKLEITTAATVETVETLRRRVFYALFPFLDSPLAQHALRELSLAGLFSPQSDYGGRSGQDILDLVRLFCAQRHSGESGQLVVEALYDLLRFRPLTENNHQHYVDRSADVNLPPGTYLQDVRDSSWLSKDGGKTWFNVNAPRDKRSSGLYDKYTIERRDGKPVQWAFVLEDKDPRAIPALIAYAHACLDSDFGPLAKDLFIQIEHLLERHAEHPLCATQVVEYRRLRSRLGVDQAQG